MAHKFLQLCNQLCEKISLQFSTNTHVRATLLAKELARFCLFSCNHSIPSRWQKAVPHLQTYIRLRALKGKKLASHMMQTRFFPWPLRLGDPLTRSVLARRQNYVTTPLAFGCKQRQVLFREFSTAPTSKALLNYKARDAAPQLVHHFIINLPAMEIICAACYATGAARSANFADWSATDASKRLRECDRVRVAVGAGIALERSPQNASFD